MKLKRILALVLASTMVFGSMSFSVSATDEAVIADEVTEAPNATVSICQPLTLTAAEHDYMVWPSGDDTVDRPLQMVMNFKANETKEEAAAGPFADYKCDFYLTLDGLANGKITADDCYLAGNYGTFGWIVIPTDGTELEEGVSYPVVAAYDANLKYAQDICGSVKDFTAAIYVAPAILEANPDFEITLELRMTNPDDATDVITVGEPAVFNAKALGLSTNVPKVQDNGLANDANVDAIEDARAELLTLGVTEEEAAKATAKIDITIISTPDANGKIVYNVAPTLTAGGESVKMSSFAEALTFRLPVLAAETKTSAKVYHGDELLGTYDIIDDNGQKYVEVSSADFSEFTVEPVDVVEQNIEVTDADGNVTYYAGFSGFSDLNLANSTIKLLANVSDSNLILNKDDTNVTLDLNGFTFSRAGSSSGAVNLTLGADLTIKDSSEAKTGKILADTYAIWIMNGSVKIESGTIETTSATKVAVWANAAELAIEGGKIISAGDAILVGENFMESRGTSTVEITGGEIEAAGIGIKSGSYAQDDTAVTISNGTIKSTGDSISFTKGAVSVSGGTFSTDVSDYVAEGFELVENENGTYSVEEVLPFVAQIGDVQFASVLEALAYAVENGSSEIKLLADSRELMPTDIEIVLKADLTITADSPVTAAFYNNGTNYDFIIDCEGYGDYKFTIAENVTFELEDRTIWVGYYASNIDVVVDGTLIGGYQLWVGGDVYVNETGTLVSGGEALVIRRGKTIFVDGGKVEANYFNILAGNIFAENGAEIECGALWIANNGGYAGEGGVSISIWDSTLTSAGNLKASSSNASGVYIDVYNSTVTITDQYGYGASVIDANTTIYVNGENGELSINKGIVNNGTVEVYDNGTLTLPTTASVTNNGSIILEAGSTIAGPENMGVATEESGKEVEYADGKYTVVDMDVAKIGDTTYATLAEAIAAANEGDTIVLLADITLTEKITVAADKKIVLDLNGKTVDGTGKLKIAIATYGDLTIKDSSADQTGTIKAGIGTAGNAINVCGGTFTLESGNIYSLNNALLIDENASTVNIKGGKITAEPTTKNSAVFYVSGTNDNVINIYDGEMVGYNGMLIWNNTEVNMTGGKITASGSTGIQTNGSRDNTKITISDGEISGKWAAIYHPCGGELDISGGTFTGYTGVVVKGGTVSISGGTVNGTGAAAAYEPVSSGYIDTGDALYVEHYDNSTNSENYGTPVVTVTGGTFNSTYGNAVASYVNTNNDIEALSGFISGGTFNTDVNDLCAAGYVADLNADGTYSIVAKTYVAEVNGVKYATLEEAAANIATDGSDTTIKLLADIEVPGSIEFNYGTGKVIFTADEPVTVKQTALGSDLAFTIAKAANIVIEENVTFEIYDNASGMYLYYGPSLTVNGTVTGGQNWGALYLFNGTHYVSETGKIGAGRVQIGYTDLTVDGEVDTNYLLVEASSFTANGAVVDAGAIHDSNNGGMRWGASEFNFTNGSTVTANTVTLGYADSVLNIDLTSTLTANTVKGAGKIVVDASGFDGTPVTVICADMSAYTGTVEVIGADYEITADGLVIKANPVAKIGDTTYATLEEAIAAVTEGQTITLMSDIVLTAGVTVNKSFGFTLDGNDYSITAADGANLGYQAVYFCGNANGTYPIKNLTFKDFEQDNVTALILRLEGAGKFELSDVTFDNCDVAKGADTVYSMVRVYDADMTATGLTMTDCKGGMLMDIGPSSDSFVGKIEIKDSTFENNTVLGTALIYPTLKSQENSFLLVSGSTFTGNVIGDAASAAAQGRGVIHLGSDAVIENCTFDGNTVYGSHANNISYGVNLYSGYTLEVSGCTFKNSAVYQTNANVGPVAGLAVMSVGPATMTDNTVENSNSFFHRASADAEYEAKAVRSIGTYSDSYGDTVIVSGIYYGELASYSGTAMAVKGGTFNMAVPEKFCAEGFIPLDNGDGTYGVIEDPAYGKVAKIGDNYYATLEEAIAAAQAGDTIVLLADVTLAEEVTLPAGITFNGNGKFVDGNVYAAGDLTIEGYTKIANFNAGYNKPTITIGAGATLETTTGRMVIGHGATFNITGNITDAKTASVADLTPSLIAPGASFTGAGVNFNVNNAYVKFTAYCSSKNNNASGTYNINVTNSIWEQSGSLVFSEPANGKDPTFNFNVKDSVLNSTSHLVFAVTKGEIVFDNSNVNVGVYRQLENRSNLTIKNGSVVYAAHATSSNAKNPGTTIVDNATYMATGDFSGSDVGTGTLIVNKGANVTMGKITNANIVVDATDMAAGDTVGLTANLSALTGTVSVINNDALEAKIEDGNIVLSEKPVAKIGDKGYATFAAAYDAAQAGDTIELLADVKLTGKLTITKAITIDGNGHSIIADETAIWYTVSGKFNLKTYKTHLIGVNSDNVTLKDVTLDCNNNAAGINIYCAQNVVFDNVSIINATKGVAALTVNGSTLTVENAFTATGNAIAMDISNGTGVTSALGVTVKEGTVFNLADKTVKFASVAELDMTGAVTEAGEAYFASKDVAYLYTENQMNSRTSAYSNGLTLLADVNLNKNIEVRGTLDLNGNDLTVADGNVINVSGQLKIVGEGALNAEVALLNENATLTAPEGINVTSENGSVVYKDGVYSVAIPVAEVNGVKYATLEEAIAAANDGDTVTLLSNVVLDVPANGAALTIKKNITIDGTEENWYSITPADGAKTCSSAIMVGQSGWDADTIGTVTLKHLEITGWTTQHGTVRVEGATLNMEDCFVHHNTNTSNSNGVISMTQASASISGTMFQYNNCAMVIDHNWNAEASDTTLTVNECIFNVNTCSGAGIIYYVYGGEGTFTNNQFIANTVTTTGNGSVMYFGQGGCTITGNLFQNNKVEAAAARSGVLLLEDDTTVRENAFMGNSLNASATHCATVLYKADATAEEIDLAENYWGDAEIPDSNDFASVKGAPVALTSYYRTYTDGVLSDLVEIAKPVAEVNGVKYTTFAEALAVAGAGDTIVLLDNAEYNGFITISNNITVDLNGNTLKASGLVVFNGLGAVVDNGETKGLLEVPNGMLVMPNAKGDSLPIWNEAGTGYVFAEVVPQAIINKVSGNSFALVFKPKFEVLNVSEVFNDGAEDNAVSMIINICPAAADGATVPTVGFNVPEERIASIYANNKAISLTVTGASTKYASYSIELVIKSATGFEYSAVLGEFIPEADTAADAE